MSCRSKLVVTVLSAAVIVAGLHVADSKFGSRVLGRSQASRLFGGDVWWQGPFEGKTCEEQKQCADQIATTCADLNPTTQAQCVASFEDTRTAAGWACTKKHADDEHECFMVTAQVVCLITYACKWDPMTGLCERGNQQGGGPTGNQGCSG